MYIIIIALVLILLSTAFVAIKPRQKNKQIPINLNEIDFVRSLKGLARESRMISYGKGAYITDLMPTIRRAYHTISSRVNATEIIDEGEKWLYENIYQIERIVDNFNTNGLNSLPHSQGEIRILKLCRFILNNSYNALDEKRLKLAFDTINQECILYFNEVISIQNALKYIIIEQMYVLSLRILNVHKMRKLAKNIKINMELFNSDIYIHYVLKFNKNITEVNNNFNKMGIDTSIAEFNYAQSIATTADFARSFFNNITLVNDIVSEKFCISLLRINKLLENNAYNASTLQTKISYLTRIAKISERYNLSEVFVISKLLIYSTFNNIDISIILDNYKKEFCSYLMYDKLCKIKPKQNTLEKVYACSIIAIALFLSIGLGMLLKSILLAIFSFVPLFIITEFLTNKILAEYTSERILPQLSANKVAIENNTLVAVSQFITSQNQMKEAIDALKMIATTEKDENIIFSLLVDLKASDSEVLDTDKEIIDFAKTVENCQNLNIFIRKRTKDGKRYSGQERKRGAIMDLSRALMTGDFSSFIYVAKATNLRPTYILALDADNEILPGTTLSMINTIAHPSNSKFDLISCRSQFNLYSIKTRYSKRFLAQGGIINYPNYTSFYYNLFSKDIFCGKGIFRLKTFYAKLDGILPDKRILSHDIIEGAILNTASSNIIYEDAPVSYLSDIERKKRWQRGDLQLLPFIGKKWKGKEEKYASNITPIYKFLMFRNAINVARAPFLLAIGLLSLFCPKVWIVFLSIFFITSLVEVLQALSNFSKNKRMIYIVKNICNIIYNALEEFFLLPTTAYNDLKTIFSTTFRLITGKKLLEWKTFYNSQNAANYSTFAKLVVPSMVVMPLAIVLSFFFGRLNIFIPIIYTILSYIVIQYMFFASKPCSNKNLNDEDKLLLTDITKKTYRYFAYMNVGDRLIADNLQVKPYKGMSKTTSPTNIGYSLLAEISAFYVDILDLTSVIDNIKKIITKIETLEKWNGNLYNWYKVEDNSIALRYVSSVDSGNLIASLIVVLGFAEEQNDLDLKNRVDVLINTTNLNSLYDASKNLFYIGFDCTTQKFGGHYDLLASESRLLSLVFAGLNANITNYYNLTRDYIPSLGNTLASWSGTMFEYLMPNTFVSPPKYSLIAKTNQNVLKIMSRYKTNNVYGISESGYYKFDDNLFYQYHAFGLEKISLRSEKFVPIISPYSTFLALSVDAKKALANIKNLIHLGLFSDYGFYEAVDCIARPRIIQSYMSHHQGMIICSLANCLTGDRLIKLFLRSASMRQSKLLLSEATSQSKYAIKHTQKGTKATYAEQSYNIFNNKINENNGGCLLSNGLLSTFIDCNGSGFTKFNKIYHNNFLAHSSNKSGGYFYITKNGEVNSPTYYPLCKDIEKFAYNYTPTVASFSNIADGYNLDITIEENLSCEIRRLQCSGKDGEPVKIAYYMPLALNDYGGYNSHPVFNNLFIETSIDYEKNIIVARRKSNKNEKDFYLVVAVRGLDNVAMDTNKFNVVGRNHNQSNPIFLTNYEPKDITKGEVLEPCICIMGDSVIDSSSSYSCQIISLSGENLAQLYLKLEMLEGDAFVFARDTSVNSSFRIGLLANHLAPKLMYSRHNQDIISEFVSQKDYDTFRLHNLDCKTISFTYLNENDYPAFLNLLDAIRELRIFDIRIKLYIIIGNSLPISSTNNLHKVLNKQFITEYSITYESLDGETIRKKSIINLDASLIIPQHYVSMDTNIENYQPLELPNDDSPYLQSGNGYFKNDFSYVVNNSGTSLPYSNVISDKKGGLLVTENGGGFCFFYNSRENKVNKFENDPVSDSPSTEIWIKSKDTIRINSGVGHGKQAIHNTGITVFKTKSTLATTEVSQYIIKRGDIAVSQININDLNEENVSLLYKTSLCLGSTIDGSIISLRKVDNCCFECSNINNFQQVYIKFLFFVDCSLDVRITDNIISANIDIPSGNKQFKCYILLSPSYAELENLNEEAVLYLQSEQLDNFNKLSNIIVKSHSPSVNLMINKYLPYQIYSSRLCGKLGFYQVGGATGFRDQLQDCFAFLNTHPSIVREQILYSAERQYVEGDVMHWWHHPHFGLRSKISDDKLYLPYAVSLYIQYTNDYSILNEEVKFLVSKPLQYDEHSRYEFPSQSSDTATIIEHCLRAIKSCLRYGEHNLLLLGTGDWNDGIDFIGSKGRGESVMLTMFAYDVLKKFAPLCTERTGTELNNIANKMQDAVEKHCYDGKQYMRLFGDDNKWYGSYKSDVFNIDILTQSYSVLTDIASHERQLSAMECAKKLVNKELGIIKLLAPPLNQKNYIGYISSYPEGVRENGGQYTHAAIWYIMAVLKLNRIEEAFELFQMINPIEKCTDKAKNTLYKGEPYVFSGDVYNGVDNGGRMGWSWYTGSASWAYRLLTEEFFGVKRRGDYLQILPKLPEKLSFSELTITIDNCKCSIKFNKADVKSIIVDGEVLDNNALVSLTNNKELNLIVNY